MNIPDYAPLKLVRRDAEYLEARSDEFGITKECVRAGGAWYVEYRADMLPSQVFECWPDIREALRALQAPIRALGPVLVVPVHP